ncbi:MAG TPA: NAD-dependent epimerase/dehydratase family protein [Anaerolineales bacterium]|jgi:nucleoside-diphosphate-sugar epimerase
MDVLITGAGGFIGTHLVRDQLRRGRRVTAIDVNVGSLEAVSGEGRLRVVEADFGDDRRVDPHLAGQQICFHLASRHLETGASEQEYREVNVEGAARLTRRCHAAGVGRFVHCSSVGVFGDAPPKPADETTKPAPEIGYERTKLAGEQTVLAYGRAVGYPVVVIRPAWVYGPGCPRTRKLYHSLANGTFFYVGDGTNLRHPIFIDDMLEGFELAANHPNAVGEVFIMAGPNPVELRRLVENMASLIGRKPPRMRLPRPVVWTGAWILERLFGVIGRNAPFSTRSLKFFSGDAAFSTEKARRLLGFVPRVDLEEGLRRTLSDLPHQGGLPSASK